MDRCKVNVIESVPKTLHIVFRKQVFTNKHLNKTSLQWKIIRNYHSWAQRLVEPRAVGCSSLTSLISNYLQFPKGRYGSLTKKRHGKFDKEVHRK